VVSSDKKAVARFYNKRGALLSIPSDPFYKVEKKDAFIEDILLRFEQSLGKCVYFINKFEKISSLNINQQRDPKNSTKIKGFNQKPYKKCYFLNPNFFLS
jgi:hypothetical protein